MFGSLIRVLQVTYMNMHRFSKDQYVKNNNQKL